jgi:hypothetical protein
MGEGGGGATPEGHQARQPREHQLLRAATAPNRPQVGVSRRRGELAGGVGTSTQGHTMCKGGGLDNRLLMLLAHPGWICPEVVGA